MPNPARRVDDFHIQVADIVAISADDAWAVGAYDDHETQDTLQLVMHWDGKRWKIV